MPAKKGEEIGLALRKKSGDHEREKSCKQQEDDDENICDRRGEVAGQFPFCDGQNVP